MTPINRRELLQLLGGACVSLVARSADATLVRGLTLHQLAARSDKIVVARASASQARYVELGGARRIVTDVQLEIEQVLAKDAPPPSLVVRVLGGVVGRQGEYVVGQPELELGQACALFLRASENGPHWVTGMAQGHFPLLADGGGVARLQRSPRLPAMIDRTHSAALALDGLELATARERIREALVE